MSCQVAIPAWPRSCHHRLAELDGSAPGLCRSPVFIEDTLAPGRRRRPRGRTGVLTVRHVAIGCNAIAAQTSQAAFAVNFPEGRRASGPALRSAMTWSMIACPRCRVLGLQHAHRGIGEHGVRHEALWDRVEARDQTSLEAAPPEPSEQPAQPGGRSRPRRSDGLHRSPVRGRSDPVLSAGRVRQATVAHTRPSAGPTTLWPVKPRRLTSTAATAHATSITAAPRTSRGRPGARCTVQPPSGPAQPVRARSTSWAR